MHADQLPFRDTHCVLKAWHQPGRLTCKHLTSNPRPPSFQGLAAARTAHRSLQLAVFQGHRRWHGTHAGPHAPSGAARRAERLAPHFSGWVLAGAGRSTARRKGPAQGVGVCLGMAWPASHLHASFCKSRQSGQVSRGRNSSTCPAVGTRLASSAIVALALPQRPFFTLLVQAVLAVLISNSPAYCRCEVCCRCISRAATCALLA